MPHFFPAALETVFTTWKMSFQSVHFLLFLPVVVGAYFVLPQRLKKTWLLLASYYFYLFAAPKYLPVLLAGTGFTYLMGRLLGSAKTARAKKVLLAFGAGGSLLALCFFKYNGFFAPFVSPLFQKIGVGYQTGWFTTAAALGISFYTFASLGYLIDVYRGDVPAEKNLLVYALFLGFFPSVTSGPIPRAGQLLPQLKNLTAKFSPQNAADALCLMAIGFFKKMAVADTLAIFVSAVFKNAESYSGLTLVCAVFGFTLQLYFDFSGYTDIARAAAQLLGLNLAQNFNTPFFATNFSGFWARWHMSLSSWLQDYIFTPLVWSRWPEKLPLIGKKLQKPPVLSSIAVVFIVSGIWHGDGIFYVVWGALQALFRIGEELLHRFLGKPKKNPPLLSRIGKNAVVLVLWAQSLIFFAVGMLTPGKTLKDAASLFLRQFTGISLSQTLRDIYMAVYNGVFSQWYVAALFLLFSLGCLALALWADWAQFAKLKGQSLVAGLHRLKPAPRWALYYLLVLGCFVGFILQSGGFAGANFMYAGY